MPNASSNQPIVMRYAKALLQLANQRNEAQAVRDELKSLRQVLDGNPAFVAMLADPGVSKSSRAGVIERAFTGKTLPTVANFIGLLNSKGRIGLLGEMITAYEELHEEQLGNVNVDVTVAQALSGEQLEQVRERVSQAIGKNAIVHQKVDESIIGGLVLRVKDKLIDASVRQQLTSMKRQLLAAVPK